VNVALDEPAVILLCVTLAAALVVVEVALPTLGMAGTTSAASAFLAIVGIGRADATWWPLIGSAVAVVLWSALVLSRRRSRATELGAIAAYAAGSAGFAIANDDWAASGVAVVCSFALAAAFPPLHRGATRVLDARAQTGMESLVGQIARVDRWHDSSGVVVFGGTRWSATTARPFSLGKGDEVTIVGSHGNTVEITPGPAAPHPPAPPPQPPTTEKQP